MRNVNLLLVLLASGGLFTMFAQNSAVDSLEALLQKHTINDTTRVNILNNLAIANRNFDKEKTLFYLSEAKIISDSLGFLKGKSRGLIILGNYYKDIRNFEKAITNYSESVEINKKIGNNNALINTYKNLGYSYCMIGKTSEGIDCFKEELRINEEMGSKFGIAKTYNSLGNVYAMIGEIDLAIDYYNNALEIWKQFGDKTQIAALNINLGKIYNDQDQYYKGLEAYQVALEIFEENKDKSRMAIAFNGIGNVYFGLVDNSRATDYYHRALKILEELDDNKSIASCLSNLATILSKQGEYNNALEYYQRAYIIFEELGLKAQMGSVLSNQSVLFKEQGDYYKALELCQESLKAFEDIEDEKGKGGVYLSLSGIYIKTGETDKAEHYALLGLKIANKFNRLGKQKTAHKFLFEIYEIKKNYRKAYIHHKQYKKINDSLFNESNVKKITGLEYKYKYEKEKQDTELEQKKKDVIEAEELQQQKLIRNFFILGFFILGFFIFVIYKFYLQTKKTNSKLTSQNKVILKQKEEKEVLLKEIHHRVKNNLQIISSLLNLQTKNVEDESMLSVMLDGQSRVKAMALIHQTLYQGNNISNINFIDYSSQLLNQLAGLYPELSNVKREVVANNIELDIDTAVPIGLILSELITNAYKYAFKNTEGSILISLTQEEHDYRLVVQDNGPGLPIDFDLSETSSIGLRLVRRLSRQLNGASSYKYKNGSIFIITFKDTFGRKEIA